MVRVISLGPLQFVERDNQIVKVADHGADNVHAHLEWGSDAEQVELVGVGVTL